tara:strand:- start:7919 stop:8368 length:450 start_codon:yes stop_codon:yes gene_type:complete
MLKTKKGFSLIELLVVIAIIGVLSAVGITAYSGYTADAKKKVTVAQHKQLVSLANAESAKCAGGSGNWAWTAGTNTCNADVVAADIITHANSTMGMENPYVAGTAFAVASGGVEGQTTITVAGTGSSQTMVFTTITDGSNTEADTIAMY